ncbi:uncharacterized protein PG998_012089 [Apiospora kogelbergensis]|uniref:uncharacterized protein n=1 Tax=Apiospora kogelbergensis TaxID=1337665 RepID=UPI003131A736
MRGFIHKTAIASLVSLMALTPATMAAPTMGLSATPSVAHTPGPTNHTISVVAMEVVTGNSSSVPAEGIHARWKVPTPEGLDPKYEEIDDYKLMSEYVAKWETFLNDLLPKEPNWYGFRNEYFPIVPYYVGDDGSCLLVNRKVLAAFLRGTVVREHEAQAFDTWCDSWEFVSKVVEKLLESNQ